MIKIENGNAVREPVPEFLDQSGTPESIAALADLSWTDPSLGVQNLAWWPEENGDGELGANKKWGAEVLTLDAERQVVLVTRKQVAMTAAEKAAREALIQAEITAAFEQAIQARLNEAAIAARYDSIATAVSYAEEPAVPKFQNDGKAFRAWRSLVWAYAYEQLAAVKAGERTQPTVEDFLLELPELELPA
ncbi:hypothetical protein SAMN05216205_1186 [Pseudomonas mohnii]|uniref:Tail assembly chaperone n=1 Tax=Pseudomonas mohnii TaxID=395600 RepID=A0ABY0XRM7_9PSED|nr:hypothetical protein [Pseudomonas mohnii]SEB99474.1 hypothetical protein SAMN05216205_1186 [Pseudomonas mohnii]